jgi:hypothetical protein
LTIDGRNKENPLRREMKPTLTKREKRTRSDVKRTPAYEIEFCRLEENGLAVFGPIDESGVYPDEMGNG